MDVTFSEETVWLPAEEQLLVDCWKEIDDVDRWYAVKVSAGAQPSLEKIGVALEDARLNLIALTVFNRGKLLGFDLNKKKMVQLEIQHANSDG